TRPYPADHRALAVEGWPAADRERLARALSRGDLLDDGGGGADWRQVTAQHYVWTYGRWLTFLKLSLELPLSDDAKNHLIPERMATYVAQLRNQGLSSRSVYDYVNGLRVIVGAMLPDMDWSWLRLAANRLQHGIVPVRHADEGHTHPYTSLRLGCRIMDA